MARYIPAVVWIIILGYVLSRHVRVYRLYDKQLKLVRQIESEGGAETGSTLVALNQRVRYIIRMFLAVFGILLGVMAIVGVANPSFGNSAALTICVLAYFYGSEIATGYLTVRDQRVIDRILEIDQEREAESGGTP